MYSTFFKINWQTKHVERYQPHKGSFCSLALLISEISISRCTWSGPGLTRTGPRCLGLLGRMGVAKLDSLSGQLELGIGLLLFEEFFYHRHVGGLVQGKTRMSDQEKRRGKTQLFMQKKPNSSFMNGVQVNLLFEFVVVLVWQLQLWHARPQVFDDLPRAPVWTWWKFFGDPRAVDFPGQ